MPDIAAAAGYDAPVSADRPTPAKAIENVGRRRRHPQVAGERQAGRRRPAAGPFTAAITGLRSPGTARTTGL